MNTALDRMGTDEIVFACEALGYDIPKPRRRKQRADAAVIRRRIEDLLDEIDEDDLDLWASVNRSGI